ncbi:MAG: hypothetical protein ABIU95_04300 [Burkholderiales bacterium]
MQVQDRAEVLDSERVMFVEIPVAPSSLGLLATAMKWMLPRGSPLETRGAPSTTETAAIARIEAVVVARSGWGLRIYRRSNGLRLLVTHALFDPAGADAQGFMRAVGADQTYMDACRTLGRFQVRTAPQREVPAGQRAAGCHMMRRIGADSIDPEVVAVIEEHDRLCRAGSSLPLA